MTAETPLIVGRSPQAHLEGVPLGADLVHAGEARVGAFVAERGRGTENAHGF